MEVVARTGRCGVVQYLRGRISGSDERCARGSGKPERRCRANAPYYDDELFTVNMFEVPASDPLIEHNTSINVIYASNDLDEEQDFVPVMDAIQGDGFNPLWLQVLIVFNPGCAASVLF